MCILSSFIKSFYCWIRYIFCGFILSYFVYLWRAFLLTSMCILGKNGSIPKMQKIKTKKRMVPTPSTEAKTKKRMVPTPSTEVEDGEGHHPCRKSSLIYSLAQTTDDSYIRPTRGSCIGSKSRARIHRIHHQQCLVKYNIYIIQIFW